MSNDDKYTFLNAGRHPGRLKAPEAGWLLGFKPHEIPILVGAGLLQPLGRPPANSPKFFSTEALAALRGDEKWLSKATDVITAHWRRKNARKKAGLSKGQPKSTKAALRPVATASERKSQPLPVGAA